MLRKTHKMYLSIVRTSS